MNALVGGLAAAAAAGGEWSTANQAWLMHAIGGVDRRLRRHAGLDDAAPAPDPAWTDGARPPAIEELAAAFRLSIFEREVLLACAGMELDSRFPALCAAAQRRGSEADGRPYPTFGLALAALSEPHWSALGPDAPLRRWRLIEPPAGSPLTAAPLRIDERVLHFLAGVRQNDEQLTGLLEPVEPPSALVASHDAVAQGIAALWGGTPARGRLPLVQLVGGDAADRGLIAAAACQRLGLRLAVLRADAVPVRPAEAEALARLIEREAVLGGAALLIDCETPDAAAATAAALRLAAAGAGPVLVGDRDPHPVPGRDTATWHVPALSSAERQAAWTEALAGHDLGEHGDRLVWSFALGAAAIDGCAAEIRSRIALDGGAGPVGPLAWSVCRTRARTRLDGLATRVEPRAGWQDLVLPFEQAALLRQVLVQARHRATVYGRWGFAARLGPALGISALFHGPSGTGKSMAAEVLAAELELDLFRIDLSLVVSKYIGETEKNLRRVFDAAEASGAVLVFDEADALFGKRSEVKDSHDRYANIQVSYLLQRMETYRGLAVLTTNLKSALDTAFLRRIRFVVAFPFPDLAQRAEIWRSAFPPELPTSSLDLAKLARLEVTGGTIRCIALGAAFRAAEEGEPLRMAHLVQAARAEYDKLERPFSDALVAGWV
jgi:hypothetical protein